MRVFIAGATGATGQVLVPLATAAGLDLVLHVRPKTAEKSPLGRDPRARVFELSDAAALTGALAGVDAVVSLVGTMRARFGAGDTYASSDVGSTRQLVDAAISAGVPRFLLLSSYGAGGVGAYLKMKAECERFVQDSPLAWTLFRPSSLVTPPGASTGSHGTRSAPPGASALLGCVRRLPGMAGWADDVKPMPLDVLARAFVSVLRSPQPGRILAGRDIWALQNFEN